MITTIRQLPWDFFDMTKPSLWQLNYTEQLMRQTRISDMDIPLTRKDYSDAIDSLVRIRSEQRGEIIYL